MSVLRVRREYAIRVAPPAIDGAIGGALDIAALVASIERSQPPIDRPQEPIAEPIDREVASGDR